MKKIFLITVLLIIIKSCFPTPGNPTTAFIVKNTSEKPISFTAGVIKCSQSFGCQEYKNSFTVKAKDSIIARQTYFKKDSDKPQSWFTTFDIFPQDGVELNDPKQSQNWKKSNKEKVQIYTFIINK